MMKFYIVDCFADTKYEGNQLLVVKTDRMLTDEEQQAIAKEINFSETTFILSDKQANGGYDVRIWTPNVGEVPFAGHPTLGTAHILRTEFEPKGTKEVKLNLKVGQIPVSIEDTTLTMSQNPPTFGEYIDKAELTPIFGLTEDDIDSEFPIQWASTGLEAVLIPLASRASLRKLRMDKALFNAYVKKHPACYCNHLFFVKEDESTLAARCLMEDFVEDPATGSANGDLAAYIIKHNYFRSSQVAYTVIQGEDMGRKSVLHVNASLENGSWTIKVGGQCHTVASGEWYV